MKPKCRRCNDTNTCGSHCKHDMYDGDCPECHIPAKFRMQHLEALVDSAMNAAARHREAQGAEQRREYAARAAEVRAVVIAEHAEMVREVYLQEQRIIEEGERRATAEKREKDLAAQVKRWEDREVSRASECCGQEKRAQAAENELAELIRLRAQSSTTYRCEKCGAIAMPGKLQGNPK